MPSVLDLEPYPERVDARPVPPQPDALTPAATANGTTAARERRGPQVMRLTPRISPAEEAELISRLRELPTSLSTRTRIAPDVAMAGEAKPGLQKRNERTEHGYSGRERRAAERTVEEAGPAMLVNGDRVQLLDRSATGVQIVSSSLLVPGRFVDVEIRDGHRVQKARATIAWGTFETLPSSRVLCRAGLQFTPQEERSSLVIASPRDETPAPAAPSLIKRTGTAAIERAPRLGRQEVPWLSTVRLPGGGKADLLNLSSSGMLLETSSKFAPGYSGAVQLCGEDDEVIVTARFVRSEVGTVTPLGVRYRAAVAFDKTIDLNGLRVARRPDATPTAIADWLQQIASELFSGRDPHALARRMKDGLMRVLAARDVEIRPEPIAPPAGCDSIYFTISNEESWKAVLQVTFDPGQAPSPADFHILRAASALCAVLLHPR